MKNHWLETSKKNLLQLSQSPKFSEAVKEWELSGSIVYNPEGSSTCDLCEHEKLQYQFEIENPLTNRNLRVGSTCIERFTGIKVYDEEKNLLSGEARGKVLERRIERDKFERMKKELDTLWAELQSRYINSSNRGNIPERVERVRWCIYAISQDDFLGFTPYEIIGLFRIMKEFKLPYTPYLYKLNLRNQQAKEEIQAVRDMERCLSSEQRKRYEFNWKDRDEQDFITEEQLSQMLNET